MPTKLPITETYGFTIIDTPELKAKFAPKLVTDEWLGDERWRSAGYNGRFQDDATYRRRISVGEGFELVGLGGEFGADIGLEFTMDGKSWTQVAITTIRKGATILEAMEGTQGWSRTLAFRRRKSPSSGWIKFKDGNPCAGRPIWQFMAATSQIYYWVTQPDDLKDGMHGNDSWQYADNAAPEPPKPEKSEYQIAFEKVVTESDRMWRAECDELGLIARPTPQLKVRQRMIFDAGVSFAKKKGGQ